GAANAATVHLYATGASAQLTFWAQDIGNICGTGAAGVQGYKFSGGADFEAFVCTANASHITGTGGNTGDTVILHYSAELGSVWGVATALGAAGVSDSNGRAYPTTHLFLTDFTACTAGTATAPGACPTAGAGTYDGTTDTSTDAHLTQQTV